MEVPKGTTRASSHATGRVRPDGWRNVTQALHKAERLAAEGQGTGLPRTRCIVAVKRVAAHIGLKAGDLLLLDTLMAFTQPQDWEAGARPIVWASNAYLMGQTGFSLSTLKRHARKLAAFGLISFQDSPNGKRWGHRDAEGRIIEAYGFDLSPLSARVAEFEELAEELGAERALCQRLKRHITISRRKIRALLESMAQQGRGLDRLWTAFERLLGQLGATTSEALSPQAQAFQALLDEIEGVCFAEEQAASSEKMTPKEVTTGPHIRITSELESDSCNHNENWDQTEAMSPEDDRLVSVDLGMILRACPEFATWARHLGLLIRNWDEMGAAASQLRPMLGVSEQAWAKARDQMGQGPAAAALALIFDKVSAGEVSSPGGYLRGMAAKAQTGALHLERSFFGRLREIAA